MPIDEDKIVNPAKHENTSRFDYHCGYCDKMVSGRVVSIYGKNPPSLRFLLCPSCSNGSVWRWDYDQINPNLGYVIPGQKYGRILVGLPDDIEKYYQESRECFRFRAYTACELICRKLLMHMGVDKGADEGKRFVEYIDHLETAGYITPTIKPWADAIRKHGNLSTHKLSPPDENRAKNTIAFIEMLLSIIYEMPHRLQQSTPTL